ncbi:hypothetical protein QYE76_042724 [Lolium multiflorum]|uniref:PB1 domain-containing protein n=1 Tax=Lolium multiflorum TaxID=4521 RepID=A0AAD8TG55_LOLMU|nr:hypothetical protein QYE76_042724 [Lolium multiflorum]
MATTSPSSHAATSGSGQDSNRPRPDLAASPCSHAATPQPGPNIESIHMSSASDSLQQFQVEVQVQSYLIIVEGRKVYQRGRTWSFATDRALSVDNIKQVVEENFQWSDDQRMTIWYGSGDDVVPLISESEIAQLFDRCVVSRMPRFGVTIENKQQNNGPTNVTIDDENNQPVHAPFFAWPKQAYEGEYEGDEPVGFNEENKYFPHEEKAEPEVVVARVPLGTLDVLNSYDAQHVVGDDEKVSKLSFLHTCGSANCSKGMANRKWLADKGKAAIQHDSTVSAKQLRENLQKEFDIKLQYIDVWKGRALALDQLQGCRPYLGVDATFLTGKYTGQLAAAIGVDGHSWMFPVAFGIFEKEIQKTGYGLCNN